MFIRTVLRIGISFMFGNWSQSCLIVYSLSHELPTYQRFLIKTMFFCNNYTDKFLKFDSKLICTTHAYSVLNTEIQMNNGHAYVTDLEGILSSNIPEDWDSSGTDTVEYNSAVEDTSPDLKYIQHCAVYIQGGMCKVSKFV